jgi:hypothetical protein
LMRCNTTKFEISQTAGDYEGTRSLRMYGNDAHCYDP